MVANFWLRLGDAHTSNNFQAFLEEMLSFFEQKRIGLLRLDSGFYSWDIFDYPEDDARKTAYITAVPMQRPIQRKIAEHKAWLRIDSGIEITEFEYQGQGGSKSRRMIAVHQKTAVRPQARGKQLCLFEDDIEISGYRYSCHVTTLKLSAADVWRLY